MHSCITIAALASCLALNAAAQSPAVSAAAPSAPAVPAGPPRSPSSASRKPSHKPTNSSATSPICKRSMSPSVSRLKTLNDEIDLAAKGTSGAGRNAERRRPRQQGQAPRRQAEGTEAHRRRCADRLPAGHAADLHSRGWQSSPRLSMPMRQGAWIQRGARWWQPAASRRALRQSLGRHHQGCRRSLQREVGHPGSRTRSCTCFRTARYRGSCQEHRPQGNRRTLRSNSTPKRPRPTREAFWHPAVTMP